MGQVAGLQVSARLSLGQSYWTLSHHGHAVEVFSRNIEFRRVGQQALEASRTRKQQGHQAYALRLLGEIAARHEPPQVELATAHYRQALALAEDLGMRPLQAHCHYGLCTLYRQTGQLEQARAELSTAIEMYRDMEMSFWLDQEEAVLAQTEE